MSGKNMGNDELLKLAREAIKNTDWDVFWKKVDIKVAKECDAYREARRKSAELMNDKVIK